ncbi:MAG: hypothetical protein ACYCWW_02395, partial [Deltaproteobacteria bacterium]
TITGQWTTEILAVALSPGAIAALRKGEWRRVAAGAVIFTAAIGLSAVYVIPALVEKRLSHLDRITTGYFTATRHLVPAWHFFRVWFYDFVEDGFLGDKVRMPFNVGVPVIVGALAAIVLVTRHRTRPSMKAALPWWAGFFGVLWLMTPQSTPVWRLLPLASYIEFPWRLLGPASLLGAAALGMTWAAAVPREWSHRGALAAAGAALIVAGALPMERVSSYLGADALRSTAEKVEQPVDQGMTSADEHLPLAVNRSPTGPRRELWSHVSGQFEASVLQRSGTDYALRLEVRRGPAVLDLALHWFAGWTAETLAGPGPVALSASREGLARLSAWAPGRYEVRVRFDGTPARRAGALVSLLCLLLLFPSLWLLVRCAAPDPGEAPTHGDALPAAP